MKKAFTMIELVFVIVILGVLAGVAVPKLMGTRKDAEAVVLKSTVQNIRKSIEAYAGDQLIINGIKRYPETLCDNGNGSCKVNTSILFDGFLDKTYKHCNAAKSNEMCFVFWGAGKEFMMLDKKNIKTGYSFSYNKETGELKCIHVNKDGYKSLSCSNLGE